MIPIYNADNPKEYYFSGQRIHRGLYKIANGKIDKGRKWKSAEGI